jgi:hypothetical protein
MSLEQVFILQHRCEYGEKNQHEEIKLLGVYATEENAKKAIDRYYQLECFKSHPLHCFFIRPYTIDQDSHWVEDITTIGDSEDSKTETHVCREEQFLKKIYFEE